MPLTTVRSPGISSLPAGSVIQVKQKIISSSMTTLTTSYADITDFSESITPSSTSSKIFVMFDLGCIQVAGNGSGCGFKILRGSTEIFFGDAGDSNGPHHNYSSAGGNHYWTRLMHYLDSPSTTSATTYKVQGKKYSSGATALVNITADGTDSKGIITLMEIAG
jgi:hypothetical protein